MDWFDRLREWWRGSRRDEKSAARDGGAWTGSSAEPDHSSAATVTHSTGAWSGSASDGGATSGGDGGGDGGG